MDGEEAEPRKLIYDWYLLYHNRADKFIAFQRTVENMGRVLRNPILVELALPPGERFSFNRLFEVYCQQMVATEGAPAFTVCTASPEAPVPIPRFVDTFRQIAEPLYRGMEVLVWNYYLDNDLQ
ncbi:predicted protein [Lichtheimia corymbifera JMRC:FSU:9682]|uniref:Uncharacterized protein n=1 Tax=Lichtheimia corymbifera JMRC:FSU:9682 TaxID=1263082 RepID=A0A068SF47_9FUNG|nr:predicted protein [Lichtheimia corymbifera JMRC:FSU:9682]